MRKKAWSKQDSRKNIFSGRLRPNFPPAACCLGWSGYGCHVWPEERNLHDIDFHRKKCLKFFVIEAKQRASYENLVENGNCNSVESPWCGFWQRRKDRTYNWQSRREIPGGSHSHCPFFLQQQLVSCILNYYFQEFITRNMKNNIITLRYQGPAGTCENPTLR